MFVIEEELRKLPASPGVYLMHDEDDNIIYVGKARSLKNRVSQYFQKSRNKGAKIEQMVSHISRFEYTVVDSETEALVLECNLIKEHRPKYNTMLMDDKAYPFIRVTTGEAYPRIMLARRVGSDRSTNKYFGPYTSAGAVKDTIELIRKLYRIRSCGRNLPKDIGKERPCLNHHIGQCDAPCRGLISQEEYNAHVKQALDFLNGHYAPVIRSLEEKMQAHSDAMEYEEAAAVRDLLESVRHISQKQKITTNGGEDRDVIGIALRRSAAESAADLNDTAEGTCAGAQAVQTRPGAVVQIFFIRGGRLIGRDHFYLTPVEGDTKAQVLESFVKQFYAGTPYIPREIMLQSDIADREEIEKWLGSRLGQRVRILIPQKGQKEKLVELAVKNAELILKQDEEQLSREHKKTLGAVEEIASLLGLDGLTRIEAYDISNTAGFESVGSMVVYENGRPKRSDYRKFRIRTVTGPDDYGSMKEVLSRRFRHELEDQGFARFPDLIMMDGGKGQVNVALEVLSELGLEIPVCGMVKDDAHRTRGLYYEDVEVEMKRDSEAFRLITRIQDEAHRFAITYHRSRRSKAQVHSVLDDIPNVGEVRRKAIRRAYPDIESLKSATLTDLYKVPGMNRRSAQSVYDFFHPEKECAKIYGGPETEQEKTEG